MAPQYGLGGFDLASYASDPYFLATLNSYNPNFRATQSAAGGYDASTLAALQQAAQGSYTTTPTASATTLPQVDYATTKPESSGAGAWIAGGIGAAALLTVSGTAIKHGSLSKGLEAIGKFFTGKASEASKRFATNNKQITSQLTARRVGEKTLYTVPGHTTTITGTDAVKTFAQNNGISLGTNRLKYESGVSQIRKCSFEHQIKDADGKITQTYNVTLNNGNFDIVDAAGKSIKEEIRKNHLTDFNEIANRVITIQSGVVKGNYSAFKGLKDLEYVNDLGDDVITIARTPAQIQATELKTLERFEENSDIVQKWFGDHAGQQELFTAKEFRKGKIPEGMKVEKFTDKIGNSTFYYKNGEVAGVEIGGKYYAKGSTKADAEINRNKDKIAKLIKNVFEDKKLVPDGATVTVV